MTGGSGDNVMVAVMMLLGGGDGVDDGTRDVVALKSLWANQVNRATAALRSYLFLVLLLSGGGDGVGGVGRHDVVGGI